MKIDRLIGKDMDQLRDELFVMVSKNPSFNMKALDGCVSEINFHGPSKFNYNRLLACIHRLKTIDRDDPKFSDQREVIRDAINLIESNLNLFWAKK